MLLSFSLFYQPSYAITIGNAFEDNTHIQVVPGSITSNVGTVVTGNTLTDSNFTVFSSIFTPTGSVPALRVTYMAVLTNNAESGSNITLNTVVSYLSSPTSFGHKTTLLASSVITVKAPTVAVTGPTSNLASTTGLLGAIGETFHFVVTITLAEGLTTSPTIVITAAPTIEINTALVLSLGNAGLCASFPPPALKTSSGVTNQVTFAFADLCNNGDNKVNTADQITISVVGVVINTPANQAGATLPISASFTYGDSRANAQGMALVSVVEPIINFAKVASQTGNNVKYNMTFAHFPNSTSWAYTMKITETLPANLQLVANSAQSNAGKVTTTTNTLSITITQMTLLQSYWLVFNATISGTAPQGSSIQSTASLTYVSLSTTTTPTTDSRSYSASATAVVVVGGPSKRSMPVEEKSIMDKDFEQLDGPATPDAPAADSKPIIIGISSVASVFGMLCYFAYY